MQIDESTYYISHNVRNILRKTPVVSKKVFLEMAKPADILVAFTSKIWFERQRNVIRDLLKVKSKLLAQFQLMPYSTSKLVSYDKTLIGFSANPDDPRGVGVIGKIPLRRALPNLEEACLIRVPDLSTEQKMKICNYIETRLDIPYDAIGLLKTVWNKVVHTKLLKFDLEDPESKREIQKYKRALICSTIVSMAYLYAGVHFLENALEVWPKDFLLSPNTEKICRIGRL